MTKSLAGCIVLSMKFRVTETITESRLKELLRSICQEDMNTMEKVSYWTYPRIIHSMAIHAFVHKMDGDNVERLRELVIALDADTLQILPD